MNTRATTSLVAKMLAVLATNYEADDNTVGGICAEGSKEGGG